MMITRLSITVKRLFIAVMRFFIAVMGFLFIVVAVVRFGRFFIRNLFLFRFWCRMITRRVRFRLHILRSQLCRDKVGRNRILSDARLQNFGAKLFKIGVRIGVGIRNDRLQQLGRFILLNRFITTRSRSLSFFLRLILFFVHRTFTRPTWFLHVTGL